MRKTNLLTALIIATPLLTATIAHAEDLSKDTMLGTSMDEVKASLTRMGYEVRKAEMEDGNIEVYFVKDKTMGEVYVSTETGKPVKLKMK
ncbi:PepSY domain-containing protein [uncultured Cohaesibacter sp.]|uniref:PepSY domain-containing protein n=1 Tax=uncultured Cohaesibacter sp. TaxID=1002546 RepID=UPI0029C90E92|nr:PepSY domain-containing protein [uncultured Cohaesibacter sp.]